MQHMGRQRESVGLLQQLTLSSAWYREKLRTTSSLTKQISELEPTNSTLKLTALCRTRQWSAISYKQTETKTVVLIFHLTAQLVHKYCTAETKSFLVLLSLSYSDKNYYCSKNEVTETVRPQGL